MRGVDVEFLEKLPKPKWYGFEEDCLPKYLAFVIKRRVKGSVKQTRKVKNRIEDLERDIGHYNGYLAEITETLAAHRERLADVLQQIEAANTIDETVLEQMLDGLLATRYVTRVVVQRGYLVVRIALRGPRAFRSFLGEVDINFMPRRTYRGGNAYSVTTVRGWDVAKPTLRFSKNDDLHYSADLRITTPDSSDPRAVVEEFRLHLEEANAGRAWRFPLRRPRKPDEVLEGTREAALTALRRQILSMTNADLNDRRARLERTIPDEERSQNDYRNVIRDYNRELRAARAELAKLERDTRGEENIVINVDDVAHQLRTIISLPGVMGLKFSKNGTPIFHVRSSVLHGNRRYDMGDYEVRLKFLGDEAVVNVHATRGGSQDYYHETDRKTEDWFCFGNRADEMEEFFERGQFDALMSLLINSMNNVNDYDRRRDYLRHRYDEIPVDLVWKTELPAQAEVAQAV